MTNPNGQFSPGSANQIANAIQAQGLQNQFSQAIFNAWLAGIDSLKQTAAEIAASVTPVDYSYAPGDVRRYGAVGNGVTSDQTALANALLVQQDVFIPQGFNCLITATLSMLSNQTLYGLGPECRITMNSGVDGE